MYDFMLLSFDPPRRYRHDGHLPLFKSGTIVAIDKRLSGAHGHKIFDTVLIYINYLFFILNLYDIGNGLIRPDSL